jgi:tetratricopeptide (TPR) repeat protein
LIKAEIIIIRLWWAAILTTLLGLLILSWPYLVSAYYVEQAGQALDSAPPDPPQAISNVERAIHVTPNEAHAHRLLGRAYLAQGNTEAAIEALTTYAGLRPNDPGSHWDLALIYEQIWIGPAVEDAKAAQYESARQAAKVATIQEWEALGLTTASDFIKIGEFARQGKLYERAQEWYERAKRIEPELGDTWYHIGLLYEDQQLWRRAIEAYEQAIASNNLRQVHHSNPFYRMGLIYQWQLNQADDALAAYKTAIELNDFDTDKEAAECHYKRGEILWWTGGDPDEYIAEYQQAIELNPKHASAHILLAVAYYIRYKDVTMAENEIQEAMRLEPHNPWAYLHLGDIYRQNGRETDACNTYRKVLQIAPDNRLAGEKLKSCP